MAVMVKQKYRDVFNDDDFKLYHEDIVEVVEGCLIDNFLTVDEDGHYHIYQEFALNSWSSGHIHITSDDDNAVWDYWYENIDNYRDDDY
jgi:hypothetical protein